MKLFTLISVLALQSGVFVVADPTNTTCSIGISRLSGSIIWSATLYNTPFSQVQVSSIIGSANGVTMDKGQSMMINATAPLPSNPSYGSNSVADEATNSTTTGTRLTGVTITNVDNAPVFSFDLPELTSGAYVLASGNTKVELAFESSEGVKWDTSACWPGNVVFSGGRESWTCDFAC